MYVFQFVCKYIVVNVRYISQLMGVEKVSNS